MDKYYEWFKVAHLISMVCWMSAMFYLPRLFVYHSQVTTGSAEDDRFKIMEKNLLRKIMNPAMICTLIFGLMLAKIYGFKNLGLWFHLKMSFTIILVTFHGMCSRWRKDFTNGNNKHSEKFYRIMNEVPPILMVLIVILVIIKPFES